jgi:hypothetical protein
MTRPDQPAMTPAERSLRARSAAYRLHSLYDSRDLTANARKAFNDRFARQVDPDMTLPPQERARRAQCARKAYYANLAAKSAAEPGGRRLHPADGGPQAVEPSARGGAVISWVLLEALAAGSEPETPPDGGGARASRFWRADVTDGTEDGGDTSPPFPRANPAPGHDVGESQQRFLIGPAMAVFHGVGQPRSPHQGV